MIQNNRLIEKIDSIDYTHLLGYPPEVVAVEVITMVKEELKNICRDSLEIKALEEAIEIVKKGGVCNE